MSVLMDRVSRGEFVLIAEVGVNYYDIAKKLAITPMEAAKLMCREAHDAGIHIVKFQTYKAESLAAADSPSYWDTNEESTRSQRELFAKFDSFGEPEYREISAYCNELGIEFCSTPFDFESADYLNDLMSVYKISSSDLTNIPFIEYLASKGKPIIMSVGAGDLEEMRMAVETIRRVNERPLVLCHCVLEYPTPYSHVNLRRIASLKEAFPEEIIGYSDHCKPDECFDVIKTAFTLGAIVVEKHFTLDKTLKGNDHYHAMDPVDARRILDGVAFVDEISGSGELNFNETESMARVNARRSIVARRDIPAGTILEADMVTFKRPGTGIPPFCLNDVVGRRVCVDIANDTIMQWDMLS